MKHSLKNYRSILLTIAVLLCTMVSALAVVWLLWNTFSDIGTDGTVYALMGQSIAQGEGLSVYGQPHTVFSPLLPILIAPMYWIFSSAERAAFAANIIVVLLTLPLFFTLLKKIHSSKVAVIGTLVYAASGGYIFSFLTPTPQAVVIPLSIVLFLLLYTFSGWKSALAIGAVCALMYLARPEYFFIPIPVALYFLFTRRKRLILFMLIGFFALAMPYLVFLHQNLGYWTFSGRTNAIGLHIIGKFDKDSAGVQQTNFVVEGTEEGEAQGLARSIAQHPVSIAKKLFKGLRDSERNTTRVFGFLGIGLFAIGIRQYVLQRRWRALGAALVIVSPIAAIALGQGGSGNYVFHFFYLIILFAAIGLYHVLEDLKAQKFTVLAVAIVALYLFIPVPQSYLFNPRESLEKEHKIMGTWMRENLPDIRDQYVLSRKPETSFYAGARMYPLPKGESLDALLDLMRSQNIPYLVLNERYVIKEYPHLAFMLEPLFTHPDLEIVYRMQYFDYEVVLYRFVFSS